MVVIWKHERVQISAKSTIKYRRCKKKTFTLEYVTNEGSWRRNATFLLSNFPFTKRFKSADAFLSLKVFPLDEAVDVFVANESFVLVVKSEIMTERLILRRVNATICARIRARSRM